jgi:hypothetical protein
VIRGFIVVFYLSLSLHILTRYQHDYYFRKNIDTGVFWDDDYRHIIVLWARSPWENNNISWFYSLFFPLGFEKFT